MNAVDVECDHAGGVWGSPYDPVLYCDVCWEVKKWAEWFEILKRQESWDGGDE